MSNVFFISDLHFGHRNIINFEPDYRKGKDVDEHNLWLVNRWNSVVNKRDVVYVLGDVVFGVDNFKWLHMLTGQKHLLLGNHDTYPMHHYTEHFVRIHPGLYGYKGYWLSHAPIHEEELRGRRNVHGHVHSNSIPYRYAAGVPDPRYLNVCVEMCDGVPVPLDDLPAHLETMTRIFKEKRERARGGQDG